MKKAPLVLVVDDDRDIVDLLRFCLLGSGYLVATASNGIEACEKGVKLKPGLIVMDLILPEINGFSLCEYFRNTPDTAKTPIIVLSGWVYDIAKPLSLESGATDFVAKPFSPRELMTRVEKLLPLPDVQPIRLTPETA